MRRSWVCQAGPRYVAPLSCRRGKSNPFQLFSGGIISYLWLYVHSLCHKLHHTPKFTSFRGRLPRQRQSQAAGAQAVWASARSPRRAPERMVCASSQQRKAHQQCFPLTWHRGRLRRNPGAAAGGHSPPAPHLWGRGTAGRSPCRRTACGTAVGRGKRGMRGRGGSAAGDRQRRVGTSPPSKAGKLGEGEDGQRTRLPQSALPGAGGLSPLFSAERQGEKSSHPPPPPPPPAGCRPRYGPTPSAPLAPLTARLPPPPASGGEARRGEARRGAPTAAAAREDGGGEGSPRRPAASIAQPGRGKSHGEQPPLELPRRNSPLDVGCRWSGLRRRREGRGRSSGGLCKLRSALLPGPVSYPRSSMRTGLRVPSDVLWLPPLLLPSVHPAAGSPNPGAGWDGRGDIAAAVLPAPSCGLLLRRG